MGNRCAPNARDDITDTQACLGRLLNSRGPCGPKKCGIRPPKNSSKGREPPDGVAVTVRVEVIETTDGAIL
jgi:hypothetical protein